MNDGEVRKQQQDTVVKEWEKLGGKIDIIKKILENRENNRK